MRTLLITGGSRGIGLETVKQFLAKGYRVINLDKNTPKEAITGNYHYVYVDLKETDTLNDVFHTALQHTDHIDALILNAAYQENMPLETMTEAHLDEAYNVNIKATVLLTQQFVKQHRKDHGRIIIITSTRAYMSEANTLSYSLSKGALTSLTHSLAITLQETPITVNAIAPGWIHTHDNDNLRDKDHNFHPSNCVGSPKDIANACLYLADETSEFINAETIIIDGGVTKKMIYPE
jgi:NAD(P)-dependent dehydrogenase (short-subunit alcohol dehydrogenase family)